MLSQDSFDKNRELELEHRPWGYFAVLDAGNYYKVKKILVSPNHRLSLQVHKHRDEYWVIVKGNPIIRVGDVTQEYSVGDRLEIKKGELHRVENRTDSEIVFIEVQTGEYLGEDDIVRIEDDYSRK